ncbi:MAG: sterol carrier family protein [Aeromicrobium sp.]
MRRDRVLDPDQLSGIFHRIDSGTAGRDDLKAATWHLLTVLATVAPGASVEVRVPPFAVVQCIAGASHTRGTPPAVVEMDALTWIALARGRLAWSHATLRASGARSDLSGLLPLIADATP